MASSVLCPGGTVRIAISVLHPRSCSDHLSRSPITVKADDLGITPRQVIFFIIGYFDNFVLCALCFVLCALVLVLHFRCSFLLLSRALCFL